MTAAETFQNYHPFLYAIAYRMTGSSHEAEDVVQDAFLGWLSIDRQNIENAKAYLTKSVINRSLAYLQEIKRARLSDLDSIRQQAAHYYTADTDLLLKDFPQELKQRCIVLLQRLTPSERSALLLKELFDLRYAELSEVIGKNTDHCRQLWCRARQHLLHEKERFQPDPGTLQVMVDKLMSVYRGEGTASLFDWLQQESTKK